MPKTTKNTDIATTNSNAVSVDTFVNKIGETDFNTPDNVVELLQFAKQLSHDNYVDETTPFIELEEGGTYVFIYHGLIKDALKDLKDEALLKDAVLLQCEDGQKRIAGDAVMVSVAQKWEAQNLTPPFLIKVEFSGWSGAKGKEYRNLKVYRLKGLVKS